MDAVKARLAAALAAAVNRPGATDEALIRSAARLVRWAETSPTLWLAVKQISVDGAPARTTTGGNMATVANATVDNNTVTIQVLPEDDHGDTTPDELTWTNDDTDNTVASYSVSADTHTYTMTLNHVEGTVNISAADPEATGVAAAEFQIVIGPGATSQLVGNVTVA